MEIKMKDKKEIPKYHCSGSIKYYYTKMNRKKIKESTSNLKRVNEVFSLADIHLISLNEGNYETSISNFI